VKYLEHNCTYNCIHGNDYKFCYGYDPMSIQDLKSVVNTHKIIQLYKSHGGGDNGSKLAGLVSDKSF